MYEYEESRELRTSDCDFMGRWRFSAMLEAMQEAAGIHSARLSCGREELIRKNAAWVLVRSEVRVNRYPKVGERVTVKTFHGKTRHAFYPRYYVVTDGEGKEIAVSSSLWVLMDLGTRETVSGEKIGVKLPDNPDAKPPLPFPAAIKPIEGETRESEYRARYTDLDVNEHVNNTKYADWICNELGTEALRKAEISRMILDYNEEVRPEQPVAFRLVRNGDQAWLTGRCGDRPAFEIFCELRRAE